MLPAQFLRASAALAVAVGLSACGNRLEYRTPISYTADTLAQEFLSSYGDLKPKKPEGPTARSPKPKLRPQDLAKEAAKGDPQTKQAEGATLDELIAETLRKAAQIPGTSRADACNKVVEVIRKDPSVSEGDKRIIAEKLGPGAD
jgi:hypothetical protein